MPFLPSLRISIASLMLQSPPTHAHNTLPCHAAALHTAFLLRRQRVVIVARDLHHRKGEAVHVQRAVVAAAPALQAQLPSTKRRIASDRTCMSGCSCMLEALMAQSTGVKASWLCPKRPHQLSPQVHMRPGRAGRMAAMEADKQAALLFSFSSSTVTVKYPFCGLSVARVCQPS
jgi:hypothetical protein